MNIFDIFFSQPQVEYRPTWPQWLRWAGWNFRNPLPGLTRGLKGKPYVVEMSGQLYPLGKGVFTFAVPQGWLTCVLIFEGKRYPWISYRGHFIEGYFGWKPSTGSGPIVALRKANAKGI